MSAPPVNAPDRPPSRSLTLLEAVREAMGEEMERDARVVLLGEDVGRLGGVFRASEGLLDRFGAARVVDTPMMELGIVGLAVGMAMFGLRPVAEIQFADFMHAAADHILTDAARIRFRSAGSYTCPLVIRTAYGGGFRGGPYHSQSVEAFYAHMPGLKVAVPSFPADAKGLLTAAIRDPDPVLFLEHKRTYRTIRGEVPQGEHVVPFGEARVVRPGRHATVVAWGYVLHEALAAAEVLAGEGIDVEVIDPRTLVPLDVEAILKSTRSTGRLCVVHEDTRTLGFGAEIAALAAEAAFHELRAPVVRVTMPDVAGIPACGPMEDFLIPDRARIAAALRSLVRKDRAPSAATTMLPPGAGNTAATLAPPRDAGPSSRAEEPARLGAPSAAPERREDLAAEAWIDRVTSSATRVPQAASVIEVDLSRVARHIELVGPAWSKRGIHADFTPFFAHALAAAVASAPQANATYDADARAVLRFHALHMGLSVRAQGAASVARHAVIRDADTRSLLGLAIEIAAARERGAETSEALGEATISLVDYGAGSALFAVPLVLPGQAAAVRAGSVEPRVLARAGAFVTAPTVFLCANVDHRALDGMDAGELLAAMKRALEAFEPGP